MFFGIGDYGAFCLAILIFLALPGPGTFALLTATGKAGMRGGAAATAGVILGDQVLLWLAVAGVSALLAAHPALFRFVQWSGAAYLAWIGLRLLLARDGAPPIVRMDAGRYLNQAFLITLLNPKAIVFYMAFFPLFIDPATAPRAANICRDGRDDRWHHGGLLPAAVPLRRRAGRQASCPSATRQGHGEACRGVPDRFRSSPGHPVLKSVDEQTSSTDTQSGLKSG